MAVREGLMPSEVPTGTGKVVICSYGRLGGQEASAEYTEYLSPDRRGALASVDIGF